LANRRRLNAGLYIINEDPGAIDQPSQDSLGRRRRRRGARKPAPRSSTPQVLFRSWAFLEKAFPTHPIITDETWRKAHRELLECSRVCDSTTLRDTLTLDPRLLFDTSKLLQLCVASSKGTFLHSPDEEATHSAALSKLENGFTLATVITAKIEARMVAAFHKSSGSTSAAAREAAGSCSGSGPTTVPSTTTAAGSHALVGIALRSKTHLADYWDKLPLTDRRRLLSGKGASGMLGLGSRKRHGRRRARIAEVLPVGDSSLATAEEEDTSCDDAGGDSVAPDETGPSAAAGGRIRHSDSMGVDSRFPSTNQASGTVVTSASVCLSSNVSAAGWEAGASDTMDGNSEDAGSVQSSSDAIRVPLAGLRVCSGSEIVSSVFLRPLLDVETQQDARWRELGHKLQTWWAEKHAMDLIIAESSSTSNQVTSKRSKRPKKRKSKKWTSSASELGGDKPASPPAAAGAAAAAEEQDRDIDSDDGLAGAALQVATRVNGSLLVRAPGRTDDSGEEDSWSRPSKGGRHLISVGDSGTDCSLSAAELSAPPTAEVSSCGGTGAPVSVGVNTDGAHGGVHALHFKLAATAGNHAALPISQRVEAEAAAEYPSCTPASHMPSGSDAAASPGAPAAFLPLASMVSPDTGAPLWLEARLHMEMVQFQQWCIEEADFRRESELMLVWNVARRVQSNVTASQVELFGSFVTGLAIPSSDVDMLVTARTPLHPLSNPTFMHQFQALTNCLRQERYVHSIQAIPTAQVPVIKLVAHASAVRQAWNGKAASLPIDADKDPSQLIRLDITFGSEAHRGRRTTDLASRLLSTNPPLAPLVLLMKQLTASEGLNDAFTGGISSYCTLLMVQCFLQTRPQHLVWCTPSALPMTLNTGPVDTIKLKYDAAVGPLRLSPLQGLSSVQHTSLLHADSLSQSGLWASSPGAVSMRPSAGSSMEHMSNAHAAAQALLSSSSVHTRDRSSSWGDNMGDAMPSAKPAAVTGVATSTGRPVGAGGAAMPGLIPHFIPYPHIQPPSTAATQEGLGGCSVARGTQTSPLGPPLLGRLALLLLQFLGGQFDPRSMGLHVRLGRVLSNLRSSMDPVWVPDPYDITDSINVGRNAFRFPQVQSLLNRAYVSLCALQQGELSDIKEWMAILPQVQQQLLLVRSQRANGDPSVDTQYDELMTKRFPVLSQVLDFSRR